MRRYHELHIGSFAGQSLFDSEGNFIRNTPTYQFACFCRADFNSSGKKVVNEDSQHVVFSFAIIAGKDCPDIPIGTLVKVVKDDADLISGQVIYSAKTSKNTVLWV